MTCNPKFFNDISFSLKYIMLYFLFLFIICQILCTYLTRAYIITMQTDFKTQNFLMSTYIKNTVHYTHYTIILSLCLTHLENYFLIFYSCHKVNLFDAWSDVPTISKSEIEVDCLINDYLSKEKSVEIPITIFHSHESRLKNQTTNIKRGSRAYIITRKLIQTSEFINDIYLLQIPIYYV
jgi:hypothetical protein